MPRQNSRAAADRGVGPRDGPHHGAAERERGGPGAREDDETPGRRRRPICRATAVTHQPSVRCQPGPSRSTASDGEQALGIGQGKDDPKVGIRLSLITISYNISSREGRRSGKSTDDVGAAAKRFDGTKAISSRPIGTRKLLPKEDSFRDIKIQVGYTVVDSTGLKVIVMLISLLLLFLGAAPSLCWQR